LNRGCRASGVHDQNWVLLFAAFFILFATMFPTLSDADHGERITVGPPFFNKWMVPIGLILLFLTGVGPLIAWRKASLSHLRYQFAFPGAAAAVALVLCLVAGIQSSWAAVICFSFCAFVVGTISQEFARGVAIRKKNTSTDAVSALLGMVIAAAPLRRLRGARRHRADVRRLRRHRLSERERGPRRAGDRVQDRQVHHPLRSPGARGGPTKGDGDRRGHRAGRWQGD